MNLTNKKNITGYLKSTALLVAIAVFGSACNGEDEPAAYGNFEVTEITVSAQSDGVLVDLTASEGEMLEVGAAVGVVDTTKLVAQRDNLLAMRQDVRARSVSLQAQQKAAEAQVLEAKAQAEVWQVQLETAEEEYNRTARLVNVQAATGREKNERAGGVNRLKAQLKQAEARILAAQAGAESFKAQGMAATAQVSALDAQVRQINLRLQDAIITNPSEGVVLSVFANRGELVRPGSPLYTIAQLDPIILRAYVTGNQLAGIHTGMEVDVVYDDGSGGLDSRRGTISYISSDAEFTPTPIQTRDDRAELVYAIEVNTPNTDRRLKIGMPGEVKLLDN